MHARHTQLYSLLLSLGLELLLLEGGGLAELEVDGVGGELGVGVGEGVETGLHNLTVEGVKEDLLDLAALNGRLELAASDVGGGHDVVKDGGVHGLEGAGAGSLLGSVGDGSGGDDGSVGNHDDGLLELGLEHVDRDLGNLAEGQKRSEGDSDDDVALDTAVGSLELDVLGGVDVDESEVLA